MNAVSPVLDLRTWQWIVCLLHLPERSVLDEIGRTNRPKWLTPQTSLLLNHLCEAILCLSLPEVISLSEGVLSVQETATLLGVSTQAARGLMASLDEEFQAASSAYVSQIFIWSKGLSVLLDDCEVSRHMAKHPIWLWRKANHLTLYGAAAIFGVDETVLLDWEVGLRVPSKSAVSRAKKYGKWPSRLSVASWAKTLKRLQGVEPELR